MKKGDRVVAIEERYGIRMGSKGVITGDVKSDMPAVAWDGYVGFSSKFIDGSQNECWFEKSCMKLDNSSNLKLNYLIL